MISVTHRAPGLFDHHSHDFQGLVDVFETKRAVRRTEIFSAIDAIREDANKDPVQSYARYENPLYDGKVTVGIQKDYGHNTGDIVEHPNRPGHYLVTWVKGEGRGAVRATGLYNEKGDKIEKVSGVGLPEKAECLVSMHQMIRDSDIVRENIAFQMEFGWKQKMDKENDIRIHQIRAFAYKKIAKWNIENLPIWWKGLVFGVTPEEGITLSVTKWDELNQAESPPKESDGPWALHKTSHAHHHSFRFRPGPNFQAYLVGMQSGSGMTDANLQHGHFRIAQKAAFTVFERWMQDVPFPKSDIIRLRSDGVRFTVEEA